MKTLEQTINHVISNGAKIEEKLSGLGTILPHTGKQAEMIDAHFDRLKSKSIASAENKLAGCEKRFVQGETRFYKTPTIYAVAKTNGAIIWFETRKDGDYSIKV